MDAPLLSRTVELDDLTVRTEGDGREIHAYAAVFDTPAEIYDHDGHYWETIDPHSFDRTIAQQGNKVKVLFNHGRDVFGMPSDRFAMPIGVPTEIRPDGRGLFTRSKILKTDLGDEVLELARNGAITGFSFRAGSLGQKHLPPGLDGIPGIHRTEWALREYGPGVFVAYEDAEILAVRAKHWIDHITEAERNELRRVLAGTPEGSPHGPADPPDPGHVESTDDFRQEALRVVRRFQLKDLTP